MFILASSQGAGGTDVFGTFRNNVLAHIVFTFLIGPTLGVVITFHAGPVFGTDFGFVVSGVYTGGAFGFFAIGVGAELLSGTIESGITFFYAAGIVLFTDNAGAFVSTVLGAVAIAIFYILFIFAHGLAGRIDFAGAGSGVRDVFVVVAVTGGRRGVVTFHKLSDATAGLVADVVVGAGIVVIADGAGWFVGVFAGPAFAEAVFDTGGVALAIIVGMAFGFRIYLAMFGNAKLVWGTFINILAGFDIV